MVSSMESPLLTIGEAAKMTGRSASTIRRFIHSIVETDKHPNRSSIVPSPAQAASFKKKGEIFTWRIREDVLLGEFRSAQAEEKKSPSGLSPDVLMILQKELDLKNRQIEKQWEVIQALNDRLREGNILMGSLQQRLVLPEAQSPVEAVAESPAMKPSTEAIKETTKKAKKKSLFQWLRGKTKKAVNR